MISCLAVPALLSACSSSGATSKPKVREVHAPTSISAEVIPSPIGFEVSTRSGVESVTLTPSVFDQWFGAGSSASYGFERGYDLTFDSTATSESLEVTLLQFQKPAEATAFEKMELPQGAASSLAHVDKALHQVKGASAVVSTAAGSDGFYLVDAGATKGAMVMLLEDANTTAPDGIPAFVSSIAKQQYGRLQTLANTGAAQQVDVSPVGGARS